MEKNAKIVKVSWDWPDERLSAWVSETQVKAWVDGLRVTKSENVEVDNG